MSKYIIDIPKTVGMLEAVGSVHYTYFDGIQCQTIIMKSDDIEELNSDYINEHFGELQDEAYQKGLAEGREQMPCDTCAYRHNKLLCADCKWTYGSRYKVDSIGVGDVVETKNGTIFAVTKITADGLVVGFTGDGSARCFNITKLTKTGGHYNINEILGGLSSDN